MQSVLFFKWTTFCVSTVRHYPQSIGLFWTGVSGDMHPPPALVLEYCTPLPTIYWLCVVNALCSKFSRTLTFESVRAHVATFAASYGSCQPTYYRRRPPHCTVNFLFCSFFTFLFLSYAMEVVNHLTTAVNLPTVLFCRLPVFYSFYFFYFLFTIMSRHHGRCQPPRNCHRAPYCAKTHKSLWHFLPPPSPPFPVPLKCVCMCVCVFFFLWCVSHNRSSCICTFQTASHRARTSRTSTCRHSFLFLFFLNFFKLHLIVQRHQGQVHAGTNSQNYSM